MTLADYYKFCPGEEHIKISNAICRGRRNSNYPKCHGCQFNDDERGTVLRTASAEKARAVSGLESVFSPFDICGIFPTPLSEDVAWRIGHSTAQFLRGRLRGSERAEPSSRSMVVGRDMRTHGPIVQHALIEGIRSSGMDVINIGMIDTPQLYFAVSHYSACGGIQTTASHLPAHYNGFRICGARGLPVTAETGLSSIRDMASRVPKHQTGTTSRIIDDDLTMAYRKFVLGFLRGAPRLVRPIHVVVDASNGMAGRWVPPLFDDIDNLTIEPLNFEHTGRFTHEPDPFVPGALREIRRAVKENEADFGVCFDGDADRIAFIDERGQPVSADMIAALLARSFIEREPGATVVHDLRCSRTIREEVERAGGVAVRERVGHNYIHKAMTEHNAVFGAELSGHFYFRDNYNCDSALIAFVHILNILADSGRKLGELIKPIQRYRASGEISFKCADKERVFRDLSRAFDNITIETMDGLTVEYPDWWFNVRPSPGASILRLNLEARTKKLVDQKLAHLEPILGLREE